MKPFAILVALKEASTNHRCCWTAPQYSSRNPVTESAVKLNWSQHDTASIYSARLLDNGSDSFSATLNLCAHHLRLLSEI